MGRADEAVPRKKSGGLPQAVGVPHQVENKPGIPPAPKHVAGLIRRMREEKVKALMVASFINPTIPKSVAKKGGAKMVMLPASVGGEEGIKSYDGLFESIIGKVVNSLR